MTRTRLEFKLNVDVPGDLGDKFEEFKAEVYHLLDVMVKDVDALVTMYTDIVRTDFDQLSTSQKEIQ